MLLGSTQTAIGGVIVFGPENGHHGDDDVGDVWVIGLLPDCTPFNDTVRPPPLKDRVGTVGATMR